MILTAGEVARVLGIAAKPEWDGKHIQGCGLDSGTISPGNLFACLKGSRVDGHDFAGIAEKNGAGAILAARPLPGIHIPVLVAPDVVKALGKIARHWRKRTSAKVIAVTGTAGKTTLKDMLASILARAGKTSASAKNNNNQLGLPVSMLNMAGDEKFWVLEAGISHAGDMDDLGAIIEPDLALIINAGPGHVEGLGEEGVARNKAKLLNYLGKNGIGLVCGDYPDLLKETEFLGARRRVFSAKGKADYYLSENDWLAGKFTLSHAKGSIPLKTPFQGAHIGELAGMAAACAQMCGLDAWAINKGFAQTRLPGQRFKISRKHGWLIFDDTYNANPLSMRAMLESATAIAKNCGHKLYVVLGEMKELGKESGPAHYELGKLLAALDPAGIFWLGEYFEEIKKGHEAGNGKIPLREFDNCASFTEFAKSFIGEKEAIIFKGSRSNRLEKYLSTFLKLLEAQD